ncbi:MAG: N-acetyl-alpha-D-glucosaminyl L-malate synthase BshA [Candidatus Sumerlaeaceae bacterium]|nr:N-acetyl-alpha-D-glucosaminyl L-malate synthase BshA [Candidatus Sumerlaeaceae bacterium]
MVTKRTRLRPLNIGIACFGSYGGSGVIATELGKALARVGHRVHFLSPQLPFRLQQAELIENLYYHEIEAYSYDVFPAPMLGLDLASHIAKVMRLEDLDIVHAHYIVPHAIAAALGRLVTNNTRVKLITTVHGTDVTLVGKTTSFYELSQWALEQSDSVTAVSKWLADHAEKNFALENPPRVIYNFVDCARFRPGPRRLPRECFAAKEQKILLHVSNFRPVKRVRDVVGTFNIVRKSVPSKLLLIGDGPERPHAEELANRLRIQDDVRFLGKYPNIEDFYSLADVLILTSEYESFGMAALEAMASGIPVVGTSGSGLNEVVRHGKTGFLCSVGDINAFAEAVLTIFENHELAASMGRAARLRAQRFFSERKIVREYLALYHELLGFYNEAPLEQPTAGWAID